MVQDKLPVPGKLSVPGHPTLWTGMGGWCWVNFQCRGVLLIWIRVGQGHTARLVGTGGCCLHILVVGWCDGTR